MSSLEWKNWVMRAAGGGGGSGSEGFTGRLRSGQGSCARGLEEGRKSEDPSYGRLLTPYTFGCQSHSVEMTGGEARSPEGVHTFIHSPNRYWEAGFVLRAGVTLWSKISESPSLRKENMQRANKATVSGESTSTEGCWGQTCQYNPGGLLGGGDA